jgi:hypothetical protein
MKPDDAIARGTRDTIDAVHERAMRDFYAPPALVFGEPTWIDWVVVGGIFGLGLIVGVLVVGLIAWRLG